MLSVQQLIESDSNFENYYKNKKFSLDNGKINGMKASEWIEQSNKSMNGNGYKLGSAYTEKSTNVKRTADYCVAFDHKGRGFDNNNSEKSAGAFTNCVAFNNRVNYGLPYTFEKWANNWSWGATKGDQENFDKPLLKPSNTENAQREFYKVRDNIINAVYANKFPDDINFDKVIKGLS